LAKPSGVLLEDHVEHLLEQVERMFHVFPNTFARYEKATGKSLKDLLVWACKEHDTGKKHRKWQEACRADHAAKLEGKRGTALMRADIRHEVYSLLANWERLMPDFAENLPVIVAIGAHHGKLRIGQDKRWEKAALKFKDSKNKEEVRSGIEFFKKIRQAGIRHRNERPDQLSEGLLSAYWRVAAVRALLVAADHRASALEEPAGPERVPELQAFEFSFPAGWSKRVVQQLVDDNAEDEFMLLKAPTGAGKTLAALMWAQKQVELGRADRLVVAMPTRFTSNALEGSISEKYRIETGLFHSSALRNKYKEEAGGDMEKAKEGLKASKFLLSPVTVCTIDHLLMSLTLTREEHHVSLFNLSNSCLVIDEADFYDDFTQENLIVLLEALKGWRVPVLLMSATLPDSALPFYSRSGFQPKAILADRSPESLSRSYPIQSIVEVEDLSEIDSLLERCAGASNAILYANTVDKAQALYDDLEKRGVKAILYHSRFTEPDKKRKERELEAALGEEAWKNGTAGGVAILTQIGEISVNISTDLMVAEVCPIDRLVQRLGRFQRFFPERSMEGEIHVLVPQKAGSLYPAPYGVFEKKKWSPNPALAKTLELLKVGPATVEELNAMTNQVYPELSSSAKAKGNALTLRELFERNWLVSGVEETSELDEETVDWKARDIEPTKTVFIQRPDVWLHEQHEKSKEKNGEIVEKPNNFSHKSYRKFRNHYHFLDFKMEQGIDIRSYMIPLGLKKGNIIKCEVQIQEDSRTVYVADRERIYNYERGLDLKIDDDIFL